MSKCKGCKIRFPDHLIQEIFMDGRYLSRCPLCALTMRNKLHGLPPGTLFQGEQARALFDEAIQYVGGLPECQP